MKKENPLGAREEKNPFPSPLPPQFAQLWDCPRAASGFQRRKTKGSEETGTLTDC